MFKRCAWVLCLIVAGAAAAAEPVNLEMVTRIQQEAFYRSKVMDTMEQLTDVIGPRLTGSPAMALAHAWTGQQLRDWGMSNVHDEAYDDFGRGWEFSRAHVDVLEPRACPLRALPSAWTPGTDGPVDGEVMTVTIEKPEDLEQYKGKLAGKILLLDVVRPYVRPTDPNSKRHDSSSLATLHDFQIPGDTAEREKWKDEYMKSLELGKTSNEFFVKEGVVATLRISSRDDGILRVYGGGSRKADESPGVPSLVVAAEHYNQLARTVKKERPVKLRINLDSRFTSDKDQPAYNTIAEIPGQGKWANEIVMLGAHMDSWHTGTGATDNAAGVAVMMEAMRILKAVGATPRRTIRVALWSGEEQGLLGSRDYVKKHFASYPEPTDPEQKKLPEFFRKPTGELQTTRDYSNFSAYFNLDNGSGRIRGIYAQENHAAMPIFEAWLKPFNDLGATDVLVANTGSTDHISFDRVGLPGFQFIQDSLDYFSHTHHTELDTLDHIEPNDLKQAAAIIASFAYHAAMREQKLPRKPVMKE